MSEVESRLSVVALAVAVAAVCGFGCGGGADAVAVGPIDLGPAPKEVMFFGPVPAPGPDHELVLVFDRPGDSRNAGGVRAVLVTPEGRRDSLQEVSVDRRGEAIVALRGRVTAAPAGASPKYRAVELRSDEAVRLSEIRWWSGRR